MSRGDAFVVHGLRVSFFTRKVTGYLDHKDLSWYLEPSIGVNEAGWRAGWNGGIPVVTTPEGELIWDSTSVILHLDTRFPERAVQPDDPTLRFLDFVLDDFNDEWFYRHAVGTRWLFDENVVSGSLDIAREGRYELPLGFDAVRAFVTESMTGCLERQGTTPQNIDAWVSDSLVPWLRVFGEHVGQHRFLLGGRPSLADFAFFGGNVAHFTNDPVCLRLVEQTSPAVLDHTHRLLHPAGDNPGPWIDADAIPDSLVAVLAEAGRHYLPWVAEATVHGSATVTFDSGATAEIAATNFLLVARGVMLARYLEARTPLLDDILDRAGILRYYADHTAQATEVPDPRALPRPADNRPYPAGPAVRPAG